MGRTERNFIRFYHEASLLEKGNFDHSAQLTFFSISLRKSSRLDFVLESHGGGVVK